MLKKVIKGNRLTKLIKKKSGGSTDEIYKLESTQLKTATTHQTPLWVGNQFELTFPGKVPVLWVLNISVAGSRNIKFVALTVPGFNKT